MKKLLFLFAVGATVPTWTMPVVAAPLHSAPLASAPFNWRLHLKTGQKWSTTSDVSIQTAMTMPLPAALGTKKAGAPLTTNNTSVVHTVMEHKVLSSDTKGARIEVVYRDFKQSSKVSQGGKVVYDSSNPPASMKGLGNISKGVVGARISYLLSPSGKISEIRGVGEYLKRIDGALGKAGQGMTMANFMSPDALKNAMGASYMVMPPAAVMRGQSWKYGVVLPMMGLNLSQKGQVTFISRAGGVVNLAERGRLSTAPGGGPGPLSGKNSKVEMSGTSVGRYLVDEVTGLTLENRTTQNIRTQMTMSDPTKKGRMMSMPMNFTSQTVSKTRKLTP